MTQSNRDYTQVLKGAWREEEQALAVTGDISINNPAVGPNGQPIQTSSDLVAGENPSGNQQPLQTDASGNLLVNVAAGAITAENPSVSTTGSAVPAYGTTIAGKNGSGNLTDISVDASGNVNTNVISSVLPTGASTSALQTTGNTSLSTIVTNTTGVATAANQTTANASLSTIATNTTGVSTATLQTTGNSSLATIASQTAGLPTTLGQTTEALSLPVVLASNYSPNMTLDTQASGTISALNGAVALNYSGVGTILISVSGTFSASLAVQFLEPDGVTWDTSTSVLYTFPSGNDLISNITTPGIWSTVSLASRGIRIIATSYTSGTATININASAVASLTQVVSPNGPLSVSLTPGSSNLGAVAMQSPTLTTDVTSAAITTTTTTASIPYGTFGNSYIIDVIVTAVSGTNPSMVVAIQESFDSTNWYTTYTFPPITSTGSYSSPPISATGARIIRYVQTISGSSPNFTRSILRALLNQTGYIQPTGAVFTDFSSTTSVTPSTSTQIAPYNQQRRYLFLQNLSSTAFIYMNFSASANAGAGSILIAPYGSFVMESTTISTEAINVLSATASVPFTCKQG